MDQQSHLDKLQVAKRIAAQIVSGEKDPHYGCDQLALICAELNYCDQLAQFSHLSHLQTGHEELGFTKATLREEIILEARKLIVLIA